MTLSLRLAVPFALLAAPGLAQQEMFQLAPGDPVQGQRLGTDVALGSEVCLVGAHSDPGGGAAYLFDLVTGQQLQKLEGQDTSSGDSFGFSLAMDESYIVVGAKLDDDLGANAGSAYVFDATGSQQLAKLLPLDGNLFDGFGFSVAVSGNRVLVGSPGDDDLGGQAGAAYVFDATTGQQLRKLLASNGASNDEFGWDVAAWGNLGLVGSKTSGPGGAAYLFDLTTGQELYRWTPGASQAGAGFGISVALEDGLAVVGAPGADSPVVANSGMVYVYDTSTGVLLHQLAAVEEQEGDELGICVSVASGIIGAGAPEADAPGVVDGGAVYTFDASTGAQLSRVTATAPVDGELFGYRVANHGEHLLLGAFEYDGPIGSNQGAAYLYRSSGVAVYCVGTPNSAGAGARMSMAGSASLLENDLCLRVLDAPPNTPGVFYYGSTMIQLPFGNGFRCAGGTVNRLPVSATDSAGSATHAFDHLAQGTPIPAGSTWNFQYWYRDVPAGGAHFNLSDALAISFRP